MATVGVAIACRNDTKRLRLTIRNLLGTPGNKPDQIVVVDDGSEKPIGDIKGVQVIRTEGLGCASAKDMALRALGTDIRVVMDAHMAAPPFWVEQVCRIPERAIACASCRGHFWNRENISNDPCQGAILALDPWGYFISRWAQIRFHGVGPVQCVMGGCYYAHSTSWELVGGYAAGLVGWGYEEEYLSMRARAMGLPVLCDGSFTVCHDFRSPTGVRPDYQDGRRNDIITARATAMFKIMGRDLFDALYRPRLEKCMDRPGLIEAVARGVQHAEACAWEPEQSPEAAFSAIGMAVPHTEAEQRAFSRTLYALDTRQKTEAAVRELMREQLAVT